MLVIDLAKKIPMERKYIYDVIHFTDKGSALAAGIIADAIRQHRLMKTGAK